MSILIDDFNHNLLKDYKGSCPEFEEWIMNSLFENQDYPTILQCLEGDGIPQFKLTDKIIGQIRFSGELSLYQFLFSRSLLKIDYDVIQRLVDLEKSDTLKWLKDRIPHHSVKGFIGWAAYTGNIPVLKAIHTYLCPLDSFAIYQAITGNKLEAVKFLVQLEIPFDQNQAIIMARSFDHITLLSWLNQCK